MGAMRLCFLLFCVFLTSVSSVRRLKYIDDLTNSNYAKSEPRHGRQLLFWFAQQVCFDQNNNNMYLNCSPHRGDFGFHYYGNVEGDLPLLASGETYYAVGNLGYKGASALPDYVRRNYVRNRGNEPELNMDRLMVVLNQRSSNRIVRVYITEHYRNRRDFNDYQTYEIHPHLISDIRNYQNDVCPGISINSNVEEEICNMFLSQTMYEFNCRFTIRRVKRSSDSRCYKDEKIKVELKTTSQGYAKLIWDNVPVDSGKGRLFIDICQNIYSSDNKKDSKQDRKQYFNIDKSSGALDTLVLLNSGLQPQLRLQTSDINNVFWYGAEFDEADKVLPVRIRGNDASLQLYVKDSKACARLYIKKSFSSWKTVFAESWVGFYKSSLDTNNGYSTYQYAVSFAKVNSIEDYNVYQYHSSLPIAPGVQIRFLLEDNYKYVLAQTTPWEMDEESVCYERQLVQLWSPWSFPEFFDEPEFYDANNVVPVQINKYDAGLQLITKEGKACARLYIMKTFTDWKKDFEYSWVGFYSSSQNENKGYATYQYAVYFDKMEDGTDKFDIYQYKSNLVIESGMEIRFFLDKGYDNKLVETKPWSG